MEKIGFYIRTKPNGFMSNFWRAPQTIEGVTYPTNEHYYQSMKAKDKPVQEWIARAPKAWNAMMAGRSLRENEMVENWDERKKDVMLKGLRAKFNQNPDLTTLLLLSGEAHLFEDSPKDMIWGGRLEGSKNWLGELLMQVRDEIHQYHANLDLSSSI